MNEVPGVLPELLKYSPTRVAMGPGCLDALGRLAADEGAERVLLVTDPGLFAAGHAQRAVELLRDANLAVTVFDGVRENPTTEHVEAGVAVARKNDVDLIVGLGGGSSLDCAKGINLIFTNGGSIADYWGEDKATAAMLPMIAVPTTAGTGSEAQSFALISDPVTHQKMACGDRRPPAEGGLRPRIAILDPDLTVSQPPSVAAATGIDAIAHAVETAATTRRNDVSRKLSQCAWQLLESSYESAVNGRADIDIHTRMLLGAHLAGVAIERSMLGAAHACANPLTARLNLVHGFAVGMMLPHVIRFNTSAGDNPYSDLTDHPVKLRDRIEALLVIAKVPKTLSEIGVARSDLPDLATAAAGQWTARFNPRQVDANDLLTVYQTAYE